MNQGQEQFFGFIMERVVSGKENEAKALLEESFRKQADGTFNMTYIGEFQTKLLPLLKPEAADEVNRIITGFGAQHTKS